MKEMLRELCDLRGVTVDVDRVQGVIRGVKILGLRSRNGRVYRPEALAQAVPLYESAKVNVNHAKDDPATPRDYQDRIGTIRHVQVRPGQGLFADLYFNPKHALAEQLAWDAAHAPENVGFSHSVEAQTRYEQGEVVVEAITRVFSVDLVADPATTHGLFEGCDPAETNPPDRQNTPDPPADPLALLPADQILQRRPDLLEAMLRQQRPELVQLREQVQQLAMLVRGLRDQPTGPGRTTVPPSSRAQHEVYAPAALDVKGFVASIT